MWQQALGLQYQVHGRTWDADEDAYTQPERIDRANNAYAPAVAVDAHGRATAVWIQSTATSAPNLQVGAARYTPGAGWSAPRALIEGEVTSEARVAMDAAGNAVVVYSFHPEYEDLPSAWASMYSGGRWEDPIRISEDERNGGVFQPVVDMDPNGRAVAVWREGPDIWASVFE